MTGRVRYLHAALALACVWMFVGCDSSEDRAQFHLARGREFLSEGNRDAALIEFSNALRADPGDPTASVELGELAMWERKLEDARFYFQEAARIAPDDPRIQADLALIIRHDDLPRARQMIDDLLARKPDFPLAHAAASQIAQAEGDYSEGLENARRAVELDPEASDFYWNLGLSYKIVITRDRNHEKTIEDFVFEEALLAFDRYIEFGGQPVWAARIEQAIIVAAHPNHGEEAIAAARRALESTRSVDNRRARYQASERLAYVAKREGDSVAHTEALEAFIELNPRDLAAWSNLATARAESGGSAEEIYLKLIERDPDDIDAHILYANHLMRSQGLQSGLQYYEDRARAGNQSAAMLSALHFAQITTGMSSEAASTLERMQRDHPDDAWTIISMAREDLSRQRIRQAIASLRLLTEKKAIPTALILLARAELRLGNVESAVAFAREANRVSGRFEPRALWTLGHTLFAAGDFEASRKALEGYARRTVLKENQKIVLAKTYYETGDPRMGRRILRELAERPDPNREALLEWAQRDRGRRIGRDRLRAALEMDTKHNRNDYRILTQLVLLDFEAGQRGVAQQRLESQALFSAPSNLLMLRAGLRFDQGDVEGAFRDALRVYKRDPATRGVLDLMVVLHGKRATSGAQIQRMQKRMRVPVTRGPASEFTTRAWNRIFLSRLLVQEGREEEAIAVLEEAEPGHEQIPERMIDLAYLYAGAGQKLEEAERLANLAVDLDAGNARARDTLGFVFLQQKDQARAIEQFQMAIENANQPQPLFHYHLCFALDLIGREAEALTEIETVLRLDPQYPDAIEIRDRLRSSLETRAEASG